MSKIEGDIQVLNCLKWNVTENHNKLDINLSGVDRAYNAIDNAIQALKKQVSKKPIGKQLNINNDLIGLCPVCKEMWVNKYINYCARCGQKLDWEDYI